MTGLPLPDLLLLAALLVAMPVVAMAQIPLIGERTIERLAAYWSSIAMLAMLGAISWLVGTRADGLAAIGLTSLAPVPLIGWTLGLPAAGIIDTGNRIEQKIALLPAFGPTALLCEPGPDLVVLHSSQCAESAVIETELAGLDNGLDDRLRRCKLTGIGKQADHFPRLHSITRNHCLLKT